MAYMWRGVVGVVKPTMHPGSLEEMIRLLPEGIGVIPTTIDVRRGETQEFRDALPSYEEKCALLAERGVDLIHPEGTPAFMMQGYAGERKLMDLWSERFGAPCFTSGMTQVEALRALKVTKFIGIRATDWDEGNRTVAGYFTDAGFDVLAIEKLSVPFQEIGRVSSKEVYARLKQAFMQHRGANGIHILGSNWRLLDIIRLLEQDLGVPVVYPVPARCWYIQRRLHINEPRQGCGRLLQDMPALPA